MTCDRREASRPLRRHGRRNTGRCRRGCGLLPRGNDGAGLRLFAVDGIACGDGGERAGRGNAERMHGFRDDILAHHRAKGRAAIAIAGEAGGAGALQLDIDMAAIRLVTSPSSMARPSPAAARNDRTGGRHRPAPHWPHHRASVAEKRAAPSRFSSATSRPSSLASGSLKANMKGSDALAAAAGA